MESLFCFARARLVIEQRDEWKKSRPPIGATSVSAPKPTNANVECERGLGFERTTCVTAGSIMLMMMMIIRQNALKDCVLRLWLKHFELSVCDGYDDKHFAWPLVQISQHTDRVVIKQSRLTCALVRTKNGSASSTKGERCIKLYLTPVYFNVRTLCVCVSRARTTQS